MLEFCFRELSLAIDPYLYFGRISLAVLTFIGYKQNNKLTSQIFKY